LYYHEIIEADRARFATQLDIIRKRAQVISALEPHSLSNGRKHVAVTVDDAFVSFFHNGLPELERRHIPVVIFIPTGFLGRGVEWGMEEEMISQNERVISLGELQAIARNPLVRIGSHTANHRNLTRLNDSDALNEMSESKGFLEQALEYTVDSISFPYGAFNSRELKLASQTGYKTWFTASPEPVANHLGQGLIGRVRVDPSDWMLEFHLKIAGAYRWQPFVRHWRSRLRHLRPT
jgi:peptidoglycan/xylan/chitin deacetylase (PgdA/CDA1 family)